MYGTEAMIAEKWACPISACLINDWSWGLMEERIDREGEREFACSYETTA